MNAQKSFMLTGISLALMLGSSLAWSHATRTVSTIVVPTPVAENSPVEIKGTVLTEGQPAGKAGTPNEGHGEVLSDQPVTSGTLEIQACLVAGLPSPSLQCHPPAGDPAAGSWALCPAPLCTPSSSGAPDATGSFATSVNTSGLAGQTIGFRANYVEVGGAGTNHLPGESVSEGADMVIQDSYSVLVVPLDIKPGSCPNPLNVNAKGVLPVAVLGTANFDVADIDPASVKLEGVAALRSDIEDVGDAFDCNLGADGYPDLTLKFNLQDVAGKLDDSAGLADGQVRGLVMTGKLFNDTDIAGEDEALILKKK